MSHIMCPDLSRTTVESAVEFVRGKMPDFEQYGSARIRTLRMGFPEFSVRTLVSLWSPLDAAGNGVVAGMASAKFFTACRAITMRRERFSIEILHDAAVDENANVTLRDGRHIYGVRLEREYLRGELRPREWRALEYCVALHEGQKDGPERIHLYSELADRLKGFSPTPLKVLMAYICDHQALNDNRESISAETLRSALRMMGIRRPKHGVYC